MKKLTAILLTGCLTFQAMSGSVVSVSGADFSSGPSTETPMPEPPTEIPVPEEEPQDNPAQEDTETFQPEETLPPAEEPQTEDREEEMTGDSQELMEFSSSMEEEPLFGDGTKAAAVAAGIQEGGIDVSIISTLPFHNQATVQVSLTGHGQDNTRTLTMNGNKEAFEANASFMELPSGEYTITVRAAKFAAYTQKVTVKEGFTSKLEIHSSKVGGYDQGKHPGVLKIGDVNGDWSVNRTDVDAMLSALHNNSTQTAYDLNGDAKVNLADLQYLSQSLEEASVLSSVESLVYAKAADSQIDETTNIIGGSLDNLLQSEGSVQLAPAGGGSISEEHPVTASFDFTETAGEQGVAMEGITIQAPVETENGAVTTDIASGSVHVIYVDETGTERDDILIPLANGADASGLFRSGGNVTVGADGSLTIDFGKQIAVKKVTIKISGTRKEQNLVDISKVEFVNDMENRIPAPQLAIPTELSAVIGSKQIDLSWRAQQNITGYEVFISGNVGKKGNIEKQNQVIRTSSTGLSIISINDQSLVNKETYTIKVRSVNGDWRSQWSPEITAVPQTDQKPAAPDNLKATGGYRSIRMSWKAMDDTDSYRIYLKGPGDAEFQKVNATDITANSYTITELEDNTTYQVYVRGVNDIGEGPASIVSEAATSAPDFPKLPNYKLLNTPKGEGVLTDHIESIVVGHAGGAHMVESPLDEAVEKSGLGVADNSYASYWMKEDWDDGVGYEPKGDEKGITVTLDDTYKMSYFTFADADQSVRLKDAKVWYWDEEGNRTKVGSRLLAKNDENGKHYYLVKLDETIETNKIQFCLQTAGGRLIKVGEIHFHQYDSLEDDIMALYEDEMHTTLKPEVTMETIQKLEDQLKEKDPASQEYHPAKAELQKELDTAKDILNNKLDPVFAVDNSITAKKDTHLGFGGLNAWQPLGKTAYAGEVLQVYVGHNSKKTGAAADLQLIVTQNHAESGSFQTIYNNLKVGRNQLTVPSHQSLAGVEQGGQLYIAYTGNDPKDKYGVRINGGEKIPTLILTGLSQEERREAIAAYTEELEAHVDSLGKQHQEVHEAEDRKSVNVPYDERNCILNTTDILMDHMMYSVPATQVFNGLGGTGAAGMERSVKAMEDMMQLFYQHKGLSDAPGTPAKDRLPSQHLNIRYMRMFAGAFMYAGGNHIGVEWDQTKLAGGAQSMNGFGWGIGHEIGHNINEGSYAIAEITNNYFAQLITIKEKRTRFKFQDIYEKVTSGTIGRAASGGTQLGLYWQLHLAYDNGDDWKVYEDYKEQFQNLFFARMDTYSRDPGRAPQSGLSLSGDKDQNLMRLACAAANKNILPFFERWGMVPDAATRAYADKYGAPETKALYYVNTEARNYRAAHQGQEASLSLAGQDVANASIEKKDNQVTVNITANGAADRILGYEIIRSMISNGTAAKQVVGFVTSNSDGSASFVDTISSINNRVMTYEVKPVDKFLNYANPVSAGSAKIQTEGKLAKGEWKVETTMTSAEDTVIPPSDADPDNGEGSNGEKREHTIDRVIDNQRDTVYNGSSQGDAQITIDMGKVQEVTSLKYMGTDLSNVSVVISQNGSTWHHVKTDYTECKPSTSENGVSTIWFDAVETEAKDQWIGTYDARYVRLIIHQSGPISIQEIDLCGPSGDNLEFLTEGETPAVGILAEDYKFGDKDQNVIPAGSLIFTGIYQGNPAYNVVMLYDAQGNVIGIRTNESGEQEVAAQQIILAEVPEEGELGETSNGTWIYYIEPEDDGSISKETIEQLRGAVRGELYRVDNALTNEGERIVSDTLPYTVADPDNLPKITFTDDHDNGSAES